MTAEYAFDLYPRDDPRDGVRLVRYTYEDLIAAEYQDVIGVGSGQATVWIDHNGVEQVDKRGEQYIRVVRLGGVETVVGGIWTSKLPFETAVASERRHLTLSGPGQMAYTARARMAPHTYLDFAIGQDPIDDTFRFNEQGQAAGGDKLGAALWRIIYEAQHIRVALTEHRHADGVIYTDSHDDDRTVSRIPDLVLGFDQFDDSNGNAWTLPCGDFTAQVGDNVLGLIQKIMHAGLFVWMDPHTFTLYAYEGRPATKDGRSTDRTGAAWGASVVRFQSPTDTTLATGNILSDATRVVNAYLPQGPIWVGGGGVYVKETGATDALYEGFVSSRVEDTTALAQIGAANSTAREEAADVGQLKHRLGDDPTIGAYLPGEHYRLDELVRVHTGTGEFDYDEADYPVGAWRISLPEQSAEWVAHADLGASYAEAQSRQFAVAPPALGPNPQLCDPAVPGSSTTPVNIASDGEWHSQNAAPGSPNAADGPYLTDGNTAIGIYLTPWQLDPYWWVDFGSNVTIYGIRVWHSAVADATPVEFELRASDVGFSTWSDEVVVATIAGTTGDNGLTEFAGVTARYFRLVATDPAASPDPLDGWQINEVELYDAVAADTPPQNPLNGTSNRAKRCDSSEHEISDRAPTVDDDEGAGYPRRTIWHVEGGATYISIDDTDGAAVWELISASADEHFHTEYIARTDGIEDVTITGASGSAHTIEDPTANIQDITLTDDCTLTFPAVFDGKSFTIRLRQDGTGGRTVTWDADVEWPGGVAPTLSTDPDAVDILAFHSDGAVWFGSYAGSTPGASALIVREVGGSDIDPVAELEFDADDFVVTDQTGGVARVALAGGSVTAADIAALGFVGPILIADGASIPFSFEDALQSDDAATFLYADL